jgi:serine/threonine-protein kinase
MHRTDPIHHDGDRLQARYEIIRKLGDGGYGSVYLAQDLRLSGRRVAVKALAKATSASHKLFQQEANVLASLDHPGLVRVSDFFEDGGNHYLIMDYIEGRDLLAVAIEAQDAHKLLPINRVVGWIIQACDAVAYLHSHQPPIIHRDVKPNNLLLTHRDRVVLVDFGIAKIGAETKTSIMAKAISEGYSPPEQYIGASSTNARSDVYALGATMYSLLTITPPPDSFRRLTERVPLEPPRKMNAKVSPALQKVVLRAMALGSRDRYRDAGEMLSALKAAAKPSTPLDPTPAHSPSTTTQKGHGQEHDHRSCPHCGAAVRAKARFCATCGRALTAALRCPNCGAANRKGARFCTKCRTPLAAALLRDQFS